jgi:hypothetical protein
LPAYRVHKKYRPGEITVELKLGEIHPFHLDKADTDKLFLERINLGILTDNLPIEGSAYLSGDSAEKDKQWFANLLCVCNAPLKIVIDPVTTDL